MKKHVFFLLAFLPFSTAFADNKELNSYRCGNKLIQLGMTQQDIFNTCGPNGEPSKVLTKDVNKANPYERYSDGTMPVYTDQYVYWLYEPYGKYDTYVVFKNGRVVRIYSTNDRN